METEDRERMMWGYKHSRKLLLGLMVVGYFSLFLLALRSPIRGDERYHYPLAIKFAQEFPSVDLRNDYNSAHTPLSYVLVGTILKVFGSSLLVARIFTFIVSLGALGSYFWLCKSYHVELRWLALGLLFFHPYFFMNTFVYWTDVYGLLFGIWVLYFYAKKSLTWRQLILLSLSGCFQFTMVSSLCGNTVLMVGVRVSGQR